MAIVDDLWLAALTKNEEDAGSDNRFNLTINVDGTDIVDRDFTSDIDKGETVLLRSNTLPTPLETMGLTNSSVRLGIRGDNAWGPQHVLLLGRAQPAFEPGHIMALAMETDLAHWLSSDSSEGHLTMRLRLVAPGSSTTQIQRVLLLIATGSGSNVETDNPIQLQIAAGGTVVFHQNMNPPQEDRAKWYVFDVNAPFTRGDIATDGIRLSILGTDAWLPKTLFALGLDTAMGRPNDVISLVAVPDWDLGWLSTDPQEGSPSVVLPLSI